MQILRIGRTEEIPKIATACAIRHRTALLELSRAVAIAARTRSTTSPGGWLWPAPGGTAHAGQYQAAVLASRPMAGFAVDLVPGTRFVVPPFEKFIPATSTGYKRSQLCWWRGHGKVPHVLERDP